MQIHRCLTLLAFLAMLARASDKIVEINDFLNFYNKSTNEMVA